MGSTISNIIEGVHSGTKQLIHQIDPSILQLQNTTLILLDDFQRKIHLNIDQFVSSLTENVRFWFISIIAFFILIFFLLYYLNDILLKLKFTRVTRHYTSLFIVTIISFWIFFASICCIFLSDNLDWFVLKLIAFSLLSICFLLLLFIWFRFISIYQITIRKKFFGKSNFYKEKNRVINYL
jgi:hypothetical protein